MPSALAVPTVFQNAVDVGNGFVQVFDHPVRGMIRRLGQVAKLLFILHRQIQVQIRRVTHFLRKRFSAQFGAVSEPLLLYWIHRNESCGHRMLLYHAYIILRQEINKCSPERRSTTLAFIRTAGPRWGLRA